MRFLQLVNRLQLLNEIIEKQRSGSPQQLADMLGINKRTLYDWISLLKSFGAEIEYDRKQHTYKYLNGTRIEIDFEVRVKKNKRN